MKLRRNSCVSDVRRYLERHPRPLRRQNLILLLSLLGFAAPSLAALQTIKVTGELLEAHTLFNVGDTFSAIYTYDDAAPMLAAPDPTFDFQSTAISTTMPGTSWQMEIHSSTIGTFLVNGNAALIAGGNDTTVYGDRYNASFFSASALPAGIILNFIQFDLLDSTANGADMLTASSLSAIPSFAAATNAGGRFFVLNGSGCQQCGLRLTSLTPVPLLGGFWLVSPLLALMVGLTRRRE